MNRLIKVVAKLSVQLARLHFDGQAYATYALRDIIGQFDPILFGYHMSSNTVGIGHLEQCWCKCWN